MRTTQLQHGFIQVIAKYGYAEQPDMSEILCLGQCCGLQYNPEDLSFYLGRETFMIHGKSKVMPWRKRLFVFLSRNARSAADYFNLPQDRIIEIGMQIDL